MRRLQLTILEDGVSTSLSARQGGALAEAASVCLANHSHPIEVHVPVDGFIQENYLLARLEVNQKSNDSLDLHRAVEDGAVGVALALICDQTGCRRYRKSYQGTGFDYWVGDGGNESGYPFQDKYRLEVSGKFEGTVSELQQRLKEKLRQTERSDHMNLPAIVVVVEFSNPKILTAQR